MRPGYNTDHIDTTPFTCPSCDWETAREEAETVEVLGDEHRLCGACAHNYATLERKHEHLDSRDVHVNAHAPQRDRERHAVRNERVKIVEANDTLPRQVVQLAAEINAGNHPCRIDWIKDEYNARDPDAPWAKLAACGNPTYLHKDSGYGVVLGEANTAAIVKPSQLAPDAALSTAVTATQVYNDGYSQLSGLTEKGHANEIAEMYTEGGERR